MKQLFDLIPLLVFFGVYQYTGDIVTATGILIIASIVQVAYLKIRHGRVEKMHSDYSGSRSRFRWADGSLHDDTFIKWKPTIINWLLGLILLGASGLGHQYHTPHAGKGSVSA